MTVSQGRGSEKTVDQIILTAYLQAGLLEVSQRSSPPGWAEKVALGRDLLDSILDSLSADGLFARSVVLYNLPIVTGVNQYTLPTYALDVVGDAMFIESSVVDITHAPDERLVDAVTLATWHALPNKEMQGYPEKYCVYRMAVPLNIFIWPAPSLDGWLRFRVSRLFADTAVGGDTVDLQVPWIEYLEWRLAFRLAMANSLPAGRCDRLNQESARLKEKLKGMANETADQPMVFVHTTQWS